MKKKLCTIVAAMVVTSSVYNVSLAESESSVIDMDKEQTEAGESASVTIETLPQESSEQGTEDKTEDTTLYEETSEEESTIEESIIEESAIEENTIVEEESIAQYYGKIVKNAPHAPVNQTVNLLDNPVGVDVDNMKFAWAMEDEDDNEVQTAYRIRIYGSIKEYNEGRCLYDTNFINSSKSEDVTINNLSSYIESDDIFYWQVQIKDKDQMISPFSNLQCVYTVSSNTFVNTDAIWTPTTDGLSEYRDYTIETSLYVKSSKIGVILRASNRDNLLMWQFDSINNQLVCHAKENGVYNVIKKVNIPSRYSIDKNGSFNVKIKCDGDKVYTYMSTIYSSYRLIDMCDVSSYTQISAGTFGFRTGQSEYAQVSDIKVYNNDDSEVIYSDDFSAGTIDYFNNCTSSGGKLIVGRGTEYGVIEGMSMYSFAKKEDYSNYAIETNIKTDTALGIVFRQQDSNNHYMWQFNGKNNSIRLHVKQNGVYSVIKEVKLNGVLLKNGVDVKIECIGSVIKTYVKNSSGYTLVDTTSIYTFGNMLYGYVGVRTGGKETGSLDNLSIYSIDRGGSKIDDIYSTEFNEASYNMMAGTAVSKGKLSVPKGVCSIMDFSETAMTESRQWTDYTYESSIMITSAKFGIVFRAEDNDNFLMWQLDISSNSLVCHAKIDGEYTIISKVPLNGVSIPYNKDFLCKIECIGSTINTYIDVTNNGDNYVLVNSCTLSGRYNMTYGAVGYRTGGTESGRVNYMEVTDSNGDILCRQDYAIDNILVFPGCKVVNDCLEVRKGLSSGSIINNNYAYSIDSREKGNFVFVRDRFNIDTSNIEKAYMSVTAASSIESRQYVYNMYVNGNLMGVGPSIGNGKNTLYYDTYDITSYLKNGDNIISAVNYATHNQGFLCQIKVFYRDGSSEVVVNSGRDYEDFLVLDGTEAYGDDGSNVGTAYYYLAAENIDSAAYPKGYTEYSYDDSNWSVPAIRYNLSSKYELLNYTSKPVKKYRVNSASVKRLGYGHYLIDLGKEIVGGVGINITSTSDYTMTLRYGEELDESGNVKYELRSGNIYEEEWSVVAGENKIESANMKNYRYIEVIGTKMVINSSNIYGVAVRQDFDDEESSFESSDTLLNDIYDWSKYTIKATNQNIYLDSQLRERIAYEGDVFLNMMTSYAFSNDYTLARFSNEYAIDNSTWPAEYQLYAIIASYEDYMYTGDSTSIESNYQSLKAKLYMNCYNKDINLVKNPDKTVMVDWPYSETDGYDKSVVYNTVFNAVSVGAYEAMAQIAQALGYSSDEAVYRERAKAIKEAMISRLYIENYTDGTGYFMDGLYGTYESSRHSSQHATAYAMAYNIVDDSDMRDRLAKKISNDNGFKTSIMGAYFVLEGLYNADASQVAMDFITNTDLGEGARTYAYVLYNMGSTISPEAWNTANKPNMTFSHPWGAAVGSQIVRGMFGIRPTSSGFSTFDIKLQPAGVNSARITVPTVKGSIAAEYSIVADRIEVKADIPDNTTATMYIPAYLTDSTSYIYVNGERKNVHVDGDYICITLGSGNYTIE